MTPDPTLIEQVLPCPFCGIMASVDAIFPASETPWFVSVEHANDCELRTADGNRLTHATRDDAVKSWNMRFQSSVVLPSEARTLAGSILPHSLTNETALQYEKRALLALTQHFAMRATTTTAPVQDDDAERLIVAIQHGDDEHRAWLREAITAHYAGQPIPVPRGSGNKEKRIAELEAEVSRLSPTPETGLVEARDALQAMMDAWFDYHDAHSLTQPVTGAAGNAFEKALAARDMIDSALSNVLPDEV